MEKFTQEEKNILSQYVTSVSSDVFVLKNLPEVVKGALFSKYSRSALGLKKLLLKEFLTDKTINNHLVHDEEGIKKAKDFYDRILDGYGDDSIGELGGAHIAFENISMIAAKHLEDSRIGGSPLEKSTRYIYFDQKKNGEYQFYKEPVLMTSAYKEQYVNTCNMLFETYSKLIPGLTSLMESFFPKERYISSSAYKAALRAKVLDCLRGLLPASCLTNVGFFGNGRFLEAIVQKASANNLTEIQELGAKAYNELNKAIPSFVKRASVDNHYCKAYISYLEQLKQDVNTLSKKFSANFEKNIEKGVFLIDYDKESPYKVAGSLLFENSFCSLEKLQEINKKLTDEQINQVLDSAALLRENRRHKSPRALEFANFTFEIVADFGVYRDLQRHRMLTQQRQLLTCDMEYYIPQEIVGSSMEKEYKNAMDEAKKTYDNIAKELPEEAQYIVPMAYNMRWYFNINLRALQWLTELRSSPAGHPSYRFIAQKMAKLVIEQFPHFERFFKFVDFDGYDMGRMDQEIKKEKKNV